MENKTIITYVQCGGSSLHTVSRALADLLPQLRLSEAVLEPKICSSVADLRSVAADALAQTEGCAVAEIVAIELPDGSFVCDFNLNKNDEKKNLQRFSGSVCEVHAVAVARLFSGEIVDAKATVSAHLVANVLSINVLEDFVHISGRVLSDEFVLSPRVAALQEAVQRLRRWQVEGLFEIHVTVAGEDSATFARVCSDLGRLKVIQIELSTRASQNKRLRDQLMTASYHKCGSIFEAQRIAFGFAREFAMRGFIIERVKIEAMLHSEGVPDDAAECPESCYFEFHAKLLLSEEQLVPLAQLCKETGAHLSRNALKSIGDRQHRFVTLRLYNTGRPQALAHFQHILDRLAKDNYEIVSKQREFSCYDTNVNLDSGWLDKSLIKSLG